MTSDYKPMDARKEICGVLLNDRFYKNAVKCFKSAFKDIFVDNVILEDVCCQFSSRGYFKIVYKYVPSNYSITIENEMRLFNIKIEDEEGASTHLNRIEKYDGNLTSKNIRLAVLLLRKVLLADNFFLYIYGDEIIYRKAGDRVDAFKREDISEIIAGSQRYTG